MVLAGGSGSRMKSGEAKQYMPLAGKPILWYSLEALERSQIIDDCILVAGGGSRGDGRDAEEYVRREILERYGFTKVRAIVPGGSERCWSVANALEAYGKMQKDGPEAGDNGYIFIHDSARPFLTEEILERTYEGVRRFHACVAAMPSKDTVKLADEQGFAASTPDRNLVWTIQTPQVFDAALIMEAYARLREQYRPGQGGAAGRPPVTDDAGVVERYTAARVRLVEGSYQNIKITTPEDLAVAEAFLKGGAG